MVKPTLVSGLSPYRTWQDSSMFIDQILLLSDQDCFELLMLDGN